MSQSTLGMIFDHHRLPPEICHNIIYRIPEEGLDQDGRIRVPAAMLDDPDLAAFWLSCETDLDLSHEGQVPLRSGSPKERHDGAVDVVPARGSLLFFESFRGLLDFFTSGPGSPDADAAPLAAFTFLVVTYLDDPSVRPRFQHRRATPYDFSLAWKAFDVLSRHWGRLSVARFQLRFPSSLPRYEAPFDLNSLGFWGLLKLRGL
jgi:hypothetical protein